MKSRIIEIQPINYRCLKCEVYYHVQMKRRPWWWFRKIWLTETEPTWTDNVPVRFDSIEDAEEYIQRRKYCVPGAKNRRKVKSSARGK